MFYLAIWGFRYEDFFTGKNTNQKKKSKYSGGLDDMDEFENGDNNQVTCIIPESPPLPLFIALYLFFGNRTRTLLCLYLFFTLFF